MCIGIPMRVLSSDGLLAQCRRDETAQPEEIDLVLVGACEPGTWLLVFLGAAREILDEETAQRTQRALEALNQTMNGQQDIDDLFADLVGREPPLPAHLRDAVGKPVTIHTSTSEGKE
ncbi:MAG TPA: HypC/HybG/HupF family hydrogenase formation chaperone [Gammaproteobacteria bacterium]|nr:HypC/HybG/HupF family hydrogenase formation chaperone [Gammaproteobacteria bacterium]